MKCSNKFTEKEKEVIVKYINSFDEKNAQDVYIQNLIDVEDIKDKRKRSAEPKKPKTYTFKYHVHKNRQRISVCKMAFIGLHGISHKKVWRLCTLQAQNITPKDKRGKSI